MARNEKIAHMELHGLRAFKSSVAYRIWRTSGGRNLYHYLYWDQSNSSLNLLGYEPCDWSDVPVDDLPPELLNTFILENCYD